MSRVILCLGAAVRPDGSASPALERRARHAASLLRGPDDVLILSGGAPRPGPSEAQVAAQICAAQGVPQGQMRLEETSTTTLENLIFSRRLIPADTTEILLVSDAYHLPRARFAARLIGLVLTASAAPRDPGPPRLSEVHAVLRETLALPLTLLRALRVRWA